MITPQITKNVQCMLLLNATNSTVISTNYNFNVATKFPTPNGLQTKSNTHGGVAYANALKSNIVHTEMRQTTEITSAPRR